MVTIPEAVERIRVAAARLNEMTDRVDASVASVEAEIRKASLGISGEVEIARKTPVDKPDLLLYGRFSSGFGVGLDLGGRVMAWKECPREARLAAFPFLPRLVETITARAEELLGAKEAEVLETIERVKRALGTA